MDIKTDTKKTSLRERPLIFLDLETTGLEVQKREIIEIGVLKVEPRKPFKIVDELEIKVKADNIEGSDQEALKIVGYTREGWKKAISLKKALEKLEKFALDGVLVGCNVSFDWAFLDKAYFSLGRQDPFYYHRLDIVSMAYCKLFKKRSIKRFSLSELSKYLKIFPDKKHRALDDAKTTYLVFKKLMS